MAGGESLNATLLQSQLRVMEPGYKATFGVGVGLDLPGSLVLIFFVYRAARKYKATNLLTFWLFLE